MHTDNLLLLGDAHVVLGILFSCVTCQPSYFTWTIFLLFSFLFFLASFDEKIMQICGDIMGPRAWEFFQGPLTRRQVQILISFNGISFLLWRIVPHLFF